VRLLTRRAGTFVDVGVNVGQTLLKVKTRVPDARYIGLEPNAACYEYVRRLVAINRFTSCTLVPVALYDSAAVLELHIRGESDVAGSAVPGFRPDDYYKQTNHVAAFPGDLVLRNLGAPAISVIKIDVEGAELEVLGGLQETLRERPFVLCEILPLIAETTRRYQVRKPRQDRLLAMMQETDYVLYRMLANGRIALLENIEIHADVALTNYLFAPREERRYIETAFTMDSGRAPADVA
jgi:FkbM family methyltransferase